MKVLTAPLIALASFFLLSASCEKTIVEPTEPVKYAVSVKSENDDIVLDDGRDSILLEASIENVNEATLNILWTKIEGLGTPLIENPNALATWVSGFEDGKYIFKLTVTDSKGGSGSDTITIIVVKEKIVSYALQPKNNSTEVHLFGNNESIDQTDPNAPELLGGSGTYNGTPVDIRAMLKFDLSDIPATAKIRSAKLTLFTNPTPLNGQGLGSNSGPDNSLLIQRVTSSWDASIVKWVSQPTYTEEDQVVVPHTNEPYEDLEKVDVTELVEQMLTDGNNHGFLIRLQNEVNYNFRIFCSSKYSDESKHPKLEISYVD